MIFLKDYFPTNDSDRDRSRIFPGVGSGIGSQNRIGRIDPDHGRNDVLDTLIQEKIQMSE